MYPGVPSMPVDGSGRQARTPQPSQRYESGSTRACCVTGNRGVVLMVGMRFSFRRAAAVAAAALVAACGPNEHDTSSDDDAEPATEQASEGENGAAAPPEPRVATPQEWEALRARLQPQLDTLDQKLRHVRNLTIPERIALRRD